VEGILGVPPAEVVGRPFTDLVVNEDVERAASEVERVSRIGGTAQLQCRCRHRDGREVWMDWTISGRPGGYVYSSGRDISELRRKEEVLRTSEALLRTMIDQAAVGIALLDLDGTIVDANPQLSRFLGRPRAEIVGADLGEFIHPQDAVAAREAIQRVRTGVADGYRAERRYRRPGGGEVWGLVGVNVVVTPDGERRLLAQITDITSRKRRELEADGDRDRTVWSGLVHEALADDRLVLYSQPIIELATGATYREELLIRMLDGEGDVVRPDHFLPVAERFGIVSEIDLWAVGQALGLARSGRAVSVNVSVLSLGDRRIGELVGREVARQPFEPERLSFEITETALAQDIDLVAGFARTIGKLGCSLAIDDFGAGYGGLKYLRTLESVEVVKIDRTFVSDVTDNHQDQQIVLAVAGLARRLGQEVVAEGIEDSETIDWLTRAGIRYGQGYALGRPALVVPEPAVASDRL
jgi:PAS domain S-box-containing protein